MLFLCAALGSQRPVSREEHSDLQARVDTLEHTQREQDAFISRNTAHLTDLDRRVAEIEGQRASHEDIVREVTRLTTIVDQNQRILNGVAIALLVLLGEMVVRAATGKNIGQLWRRKERVGEPSVE